MVSSPQENESGKKEPTRFLELQPLTTAWLTLTSPWTLTISTLLIAILLVASAAVPQGLGGHELLEHFSFSEGRVIEGTGLQNVWTGWTMVILAIIGLLSLVGFLLRRFPTFGGDGDERRVPFFVSSAERTVSLKPQQVVERLNTLGVKGKPTEPTADGRILIQTFHLRAQTTWLIVLGLLLCAISLVLDSQGATRHEVDHIPSRPAVEATTRILEDGRWVDQKVGFSFRCTAADPANIASRVRTCVFRSDGQTYKFPLHAGEAVRAGDHRIQFVQEKPIATREITDRGGNPTGRIPVRLLLEGDSPKLVSGESGQWVRLEDGRELKLIASPDGPVVVVREKDKLPVLLVPRAVLPSEGNARYTGMSAVPDWTLTTSISSEPGRLLRYGSWLVVAFGLLFLLFFRHLDVVITPMDEETTLVELRSANRPNAPTLLTNKLGEEAAA